MNDNSDTPQNSGPPQAAPDTNNEKPKARSPRHQLHVLVATLLVVLIVVVTVWWHLRDPASGAGAEQSSDAAELRPQFVGSAEGQFEYVGGFGKHP